MRLSAEERLENAGFTDVVTLEGYSYDSALVGVTECGRAVYDFAKMVEWLAENKGFTRDEAIDWVRDNTVRALPYAGPYAPVIMYRLEEGEDV